MSKLITNTITPQSGDTVTISNKLNIQGLLTYEDVTNVDSVGIITARDGIICTGIVTATTFDGSGADLTNIPAAQLTGTLPAISAANLTGIDNINEGNTKAEVIDTGSDGHFKVETEGTERLRITAGGLVDVSGGIHVTENVTPTSGRGVEIFEASAGVGQIQSFNRTGGSFDDLNIKGSEVKIHTGSTNVLTLDLQNTASTLYGNSDGILNLDTTDNRGPFIRFKYDTTTKQWVGSAEGMGGGITADQDDLGLRAVGNIFLSANGAERVRITESGQFNVGAGGFIVESDGDISTNVRGHGHIELDSTGSFSSPKVKLFSNTGNAEFAGNITAGGNLDFTDTTCDLYSQTTTSSSKTFQLFSDIGGTKTEKVFIQADGSASLSGRITAAGFDLASLTALP